MSRTVNWAGKPAPLSGNAVRPGVKAPDAVLKMDFNTEVPLSGTTGRVRVVSVTPSLDTGTCAMQTKRFYDAAAQLPDVDFIGVSCDLPVAQSRFCKQENIDPERMRFLSDYHRRAFGHAFGTYMDSVGLNCRAVFVLDRDDTVRHVEYVVETGTEPDYDAVLHSLHAIA